MPKGRRQCVVDVGEPAWPPEDSRRMVVNRGYVPETPVGVTVSPTRAGEPAHGGWKFRSVIGWCTENVHIRWELGGDCTVGSC